MNGLEEARMRRDETTDDAARRDSRRGAPGSVLIIVQNLPVPFDKRVWLECRALIDAGHRVSVVCPKGPGDPWHHRIDGVDIYKYRGFSTTGGLLGFIAEYLYSFTMTFLLALVVRSRKRIDVIQTCNPPDIFWALALVFRVLGVRRFVFDQHDLCPELYRSRFPNGAKLPLKMLLWLERRTYRLADHVISTNASYRKMALDRGGKRPDEVTIVRTGPDPTKLRRIEATDGLRRGRDHLVCYLGVMGPQDGVDLVVRAADIVVNQFGRSDIAFTLIGRGDCFDELQELTQRLGLTDVVHFTGRIPDADVAALLSTASLGLSPDPKNPLNDVSTMNKTMEYMAYELPVVAFDLIETKVSAGDAAVYVPTPSNGTPDVEGYAKAIVSLIDDAERRTTMGALGRQRVEEQLAWQHQRANYLSVYETVLGAS
jgi:glycosyltransferase involved in cell wall biosynthesis